MPRASSLSRALVALALLVALTCAAASVVSLVPGDVPSLESAAAVGAPLICTTGLLAAASALLIGRRHSSRSRRAVAYAALVACLLPLALVAPGFVPHGPRSTGPRLTVLSFNTYGGGVDGQLVEAAARYRPDVIGLLECGPGCAQRLPILMEKHGYRLVGTANQTRTGLYYRGAVVLARTGVQTGAVTPTRTSTGEIGYGGASTTVTVSGRVVHLDLVHLSNPLTHAHAWVADQERVASLLAGPSPRIVVGDLNTTLFHNRMRITLWRTGARTCTSDLGRALRPTWGKQGGPYYLQIDHALVRGLTCQSMATVPLQWSDHQALVTTVAL